MKVFEKYAEYYDLLYQDKDYPAEANFIHELIQKHFPHAESILDLGCGTGNHALALLDFGYQITGIDKSKFNIKQARDKLYDSDSNPTEIDFRKADICQIRLDHRYDVVTSLFHVISYQINNKDLEAVFQTAQYHLKKGGLFIFDCWYGPAVLYDRPAVRIKTKDAEHLKVTRIAEPEIFPNKNRVDVSYHLIVQDKKTGKISEIYETHQMRYLFKPEIQNFLVYAGLELIDCAEWMTNKVPGFDTWGVYFVSSK
jgi:SAM-dependent methyltransferase